MKYLSNSFPILRLWGILPYVEAWGVWAMQNWHFVLAIAGIVFVVLSCRRLVRDQRTQHRAQQMPDWRLTDD